MITIVLRNGLVTTAKDEEPGLKTIRLEKNDGEGHDYFIDWNEFDFGDNDGEKPAIVKKKSTGQILSLKETIQRKKNKVMMMVKAMRSVTATKVEEKYEDYPTCGEVSCKLSQLDLTFVEDSFFDSLKDIRVREAKTKFLCYDPVSGKSSEVLTSIFLRYKAQAYYEDPRIRNRKVFEKLLQDFRFALNSKNITVSQTLAPCYALHGISLFANCLANAKRVAWDTLVDDVTLNRILGILGRPFSCKYPHRNNIAFQALLALWSLASNSYLLRTRLTTLRAAEAILDFAWPLIQNSTLPLEERNQYIICVLGAFVSLSFDARAHSQIWKLRTVKLFALILGQDSLDESQKQMNALMFKFMSNGSVALRAYLENDGPVETVVEVLAHLLRRCRKANGQFFRKRASAVIGILANISHVQSVFSELPTDAVDTVLEIIGTTYMRKDLDEKQEYHFLLCSLLNLLALSQIPNSTEKAFQVLLSYSSSEYEYSHENNSVVEKASLEVLVDALALVETDGLDDSIDSIAQAMIYRLGQTRPMAHNIAFNFARLRMKGLHPKLCMALQRYSVFKVLNESLDRWWDVKHTRVQLTSAILTLTNFARNTPLEGGKEIVDSIMESLTRFADDGPEWLKDGTSVSNVASVIWNLACISPILPAHFEFIQTIATAFYRVHDKPVWGLVCGAMTQSVVRLMETHTPSPEISALHMTFTQFLVQQMKRAGGWIQACDLKNPAKIMAREAQIASKLASISQKERKRISRETGNNMDNTKLTVLSSNASTLQAPFGCSPMLKETERVIQSFLTEKFRKEAEEVKLERAHQEIGSDDEPEQDESETEQKQDATVEFDVQQDYVPVSHRCNTVLSMLLYILESLYNLEWFDSILESLRADSIELLFFLVHHSDVGPLVYENCLRVFWRILLFDDEDSPHIYRFADAVNKILVRDIGTSGTLGTRYALRLLKTLGMSKQKKKSQLLKNIRRSKLIQTLLECLQKHGCLVTRANAMGALLIASECKNLQPFIAHQPLALETFVAKASAGGGELSVTRELAIKTLSNLKTNPENLTPFYTCELAVKHLRTVLQRVSNNQAVAKRRECHDTRVESIVYLGAELTAPATDIQEAEMAILQASRALHFSQPLHIYPRRSAVVVMYDESVQVTIQMATDDPDIVEEDIIPAPRTKTTVARVYAKPAWVRGGFFCARMLPVQSFHPEPLINPHKFLEPHTGLLREAQLEIVVVKTPEVANGSSETSVRRQRHSVAMPKESEWDLKKSVFQSRINPTSDAGRFWDSREDLMKAFKWDWNTLKRQTPYVKRILSFHIDSDIQNVKTCLKDEYAAICKVFTYYATTDERENTTFVEQTTNIFTMSRGQFCQFVNDFDLLSLANHMTFDAFESIYDFVTTNQLAQTPEEIKTNMESEIIKHQKRGGGFLRYHFLVCLMVLAHEMFVKAPDNFPLKMKYLCRGVNLLLERCFRKASELPLMNADLFRYKNLYTPTTNEVFQRHLVRLREALFQPFAGTSEDSSLWGGIRGLRMSLLDWHTLLDRVGLNLNPYLAAIESNLIFSLSILQVENLTADWRKACALSFSSFMEAIARLATTLPLPTPRQVADLGMDNYLQYYSLCQSTNLWWYHMGPPSDSPEILDWIDGVGWRANSSRSGGSSENSVPDLDIDKLEGLMDILFAFDAIQAKLELCHACWDNRITQPDMCCETFDSQVARDLHENKCLATGDTVRELQWRKYIHKGKEIDLSLTAFDDLPRAVVKEYCVSAYVSCEMLRGELEAVRWKQKIFSGSMVQNAPEFEIGEMENAGFTTNNLLNINFTGHEKLAKTPLNETDAVVLARIKKDRFQRRAAVQLYKSWKLRNPTSVQALDDIPFDKIEPHERQNFLEVVQVTVARFTHHTRLFWFNNQ